MVDRCCNVFTNVEYENKTKFRFISVDESTVKLSYRRRAKLSWAYPETFPISARRNLSFMLTRARKSV